MACSFDLSRRRGVHTKHDCRPSGPPRDVDRSSTPPLRRGDCVTISVTKRNSRTKRSHQPTLGPGNVVGAVKIGTVPCERLLPYFPAKSCKSNQTLAVDDVVFRAFSPLMDAPVGDRLQFRGRPTHPLPTRMPCPKKSPRTGRASGCLWSRWIHRSHRSSRAEVCAWPANWLGDGGDDGICAPFAVDSFSA